MFERTATTTGATTCNRPIKLVRWLRVNTCPASINSKPSHKKTIKQTVTMDTDTRTAVLSYFARVRFLPQGTEAILLEGRPLTSLYNKLGISPVAAYTLENQFFDVDLIDEMLSADGLYIAYGKLQNFFEVQTTEDGQHQTLVINTVDAAAKRSTGRTVAFSAAFERLKRTLCRQFLAQDHETGCFYREGAGT